jgi:hypothetical protein
MSQEKPEMKRVVEEIITNLGKQGIKVTEAAVLKLDDASTKNPATDAVVDQAVNSILQKMKGGFPGVKKAPLPQAIQPQQTVNQEQPNQVEEECFCPGCFNFESFEAKLQKFGGIFDYATVTLGGKPFDIKYHNAPNRGESIMVSQESTLLIPH